MLFYRLLFSWLFSLILNFFSPMAADESILQQDRANQAEVSPDGYVDDPNNKKNKKTKR